MRADERKAQATGRASSAAIAQDLGKVWKNYFPEETSLPADPKAQLAADLVECFCSEAKRLLSPVSTRAPQISYAALLSESASQFGVMLGFRSIGAVPKTSVCVWSAVGIVLFVTREMGRKLECLAHVMWGAVVFVVVYVSTRAMWRVVVD